MIVWVVLIEEGGEIIQRVTVLQYVPVISPGAQTGLPAARIAPCLKGESREHPCQELGHPSGTYQDGKGSGEDGTAQDGTAGL